MAGGFLGQGAAVGRHRRSRSCPSERQPDAVSEGFSELISSHTGTAQGAPNEPCDMSLRPVHGRSVQSRNLHTINGIINAATVSVGRFRPPFSLGPSKKFRPAKRSGNKVMYL